MSKPPVGGRAGERVGGTRGRGEQWTRVTRARVAQGTPCEVAFARQLYIIGVYTRECVWVLPHPSSCRALASSCTRPQLQPQTTWWRARPWRRSVVAALAAAGLPCPWLRTTRVGKMAIKSGRGRFRLWWSSSCRAGQDTPVFICSGVVRRGNGQRLPPLRKAMPCKNAPTQLGATVLLSFCARDHRHNRRWHPCGAAASFFWGRGVCSMKSAWAGSDAGWAGRRPALCIARRGSQSLSASARANIQRTSARPRRAAAERRRQHHHRKPRVPPATLAS